ncbi:MAG: GNAT family N-acetyltransferase [Aquiluna sp.]|nr:GNAT family N-acetyltransferase [Aquiluna sp.]
MVDSETRWAMVRRSRQKPPAEAVEVLIRNLEESDLPAIKDIYNYFIRNTAITFDDVPLKLSYWQEKYEMAKKFELPFLVLTRGSQVIGFAYVSPWRQKSGYLKVVENSIYLSAPATGKGHGSQLLMALLDSCKASGIKEIIAVIADRGAHASIALHEKYGFIQQGHLANVAVRFGKPIGSHMLSLKMSNH